MASLQLKPLVALSLLYALPPFAALNEASAAEYVIAISVDGLRSSAISELGPEELPNLYRFRTEGVWTDQARTDEDTFTVPNHVAMITARPYGGQSGYVPSMFDVAHDHGFSTAFYSSKVKLRFIDRDYSETTGAEDITGEDNGQDKIDHYEETDTLVSDVLIDLFLEHMRANPYHLSFVHMVDPDWAGHGDGWNSEPYSEAVRQVDAYLGQIFDLVEEEPFAGKTTVLLTSDHGGIDNFHSSTDLESHIIPFYAWGVDVPVPGDLYAINSQSRTFPGDERPSYDAAEQPIRNGDLGNLCLDLLGLPPIPDEEAIINRNQDLKLTNPSPVQRWTQVQIERDDEEISLSWESAGSGILYQVESNPALHPDSWEVVADTEPTAELSTRLPADLAKATFVCASFQPKNDSDREGDPLKKVSLAASGTTRLNATGKTP